MTSPQERLAVLYETVYQLDLSLSGEEYQHDLRLLNALTPEDQKEIILLWNAIAPIFIDDSDDESSVEEFITQIHKARQIVRKNLLRIVTETLAFLPSELVCLTRDFC